MRFALFFSLLCWNLNTPGATYHTNTIEGWRVLIDQRLLSDNQAATEKALNLLTIQLREIVAKVPAPAVTKLRNVTLWFSPQYSNVTAKAEYHPGAEWLREHNRNPDMVRGVEFTNIDKFESETRRMPNFTLHELAHAFHHGFLQDGFENTAIKTAFDGAKAKGAYDKVERWNGTARAAAKERAYAMVNQMEYFAETTEAFFSRNDFFPFTREELKRHDPEMHDLLVKLWAAE